MENNSKR